MKKILACIFAVSIISTAAFSKNFFSQRYFEIKVGTDVDFSNNLFTANELLVQDLEIDLKKLAQECPESGFNLRAGANPNLGLNLNIKNFHLGIDAGVDVYESLTVGKGLFDFLGYGNTIGEESKFTLDNNTEVFAYSQVDLGLKIGKVRFNVKPAVFLPLVSIRGSGGTITVKNDTDGNMIASMDLDMDVYSIAEIQQTSDGKIVIDPEKLQAAFTKGYGFDIAGGLGIDVSDSFIIGANCRIPVLPGHLNYKSNVKTGFDFKMKVTDYQNAETTKQDVTITTTETNLAVHRPLKASAYFDKNMLGTLFNLHAAGGIGIRSPFCDQAVIYPEYYVGFTLNVFDIFRLGVSTEYTDQVFIHQVGTTVNIRLIQIDLGLSSQSSDFKKSWSVPGVGAYAYVTVGF